MGRRSDHSRAELQALIVAVGHGLMAEQGFARFSTREVAKRIGYSVGTIYNMFENADALVVAINTCTFALWADHLKAALRVAGDDRIGALVEGYFDFAQTNPNLWMAIYEHRIPTTMPIPESDAATRAVLTAIVIEEVARALDSEIDASVSALSRSLIATVHGHCAFAVSGSFALMGEDQPVDIALARVREILDAHGAVRLDAPRGFEPRLTESESVVLPLDDRAMPAPRR